MGNIGCRDSDHAEECVGMPRLEVAQQAAVISAYLKIGFLDEIINNCIAGFSISMGDAPDNGTDKLSKAAYELLPRLVIA
jgi:hypothetical protein